MEENRKIKYAENVSLISVVYNEVKNIDKFLTSYRNQTIYANEFIIVDGASNDGTTEKIIEFAKLNPKLKIKIISDKIYNRENHIAPIAKARNDAIRMSKNEIISVTDAGCTLGTDWLENIIKPFSDYSIDVSSGWYEAVTESDFQKRFSYLFLPVKETITAEYFLPSSRSIAFRRSCWEEIGGYPEKAYNGEDTMFDILLKRKNKNFYFASEAIVFWNCPENLKDACEKYSNYGYGDGVFRLFKVYYLKKLFHFFCPVKFLFKKDFFLLYKINNVLLFGYMKGFIKSILK